MIFQNSFKLQSPEFRPLRSWWNKGRFQCCASCLSCVHNCAPCKAFSYRGTYALDKAKRDTRGCAREVITAMINDTFIYLSPQYKYMIFHIFTCILHHLRGYITNSQRDQLPDGLIAQLVEHCTGMAEVLGSNPGQAWKRFYITCNKISENFNFGQKSSRFFASNLLRRVQ